ncbi:MAG: helix-turn-helix domain-containing protein [[Clostridium] scindens]
MPRVVLTESQRDREAVESLIKKHAGAMRLTMPMLAKRIGMPSATLYKRLHDPDTFRRGEMKRICKALKMPGGREGRAAGMKEFIRDLVAGFLIGLATGAGIIVVMLVYCRMAGPII